MVAPDPGDGFSILWNREERTGARRVAEVLSIGRAVWDRPHGSGRLRSVFRIDAVVSGVRSTARSIQPPALTLWRIGMTGIVHDGHR
jgi:hypothetical protein